jgi:hypothetical protein
MNTNTIILYVTYVLVIIVVVVAGYFRVLPNDLVISTFTLIIGHFLGVQVPTPLKSNVESVTK